MKLLDQAAESPWFQRPLLGLPGIGPVTAEKFAARGLVTILDFLRHVPVDWQDRRQVTLLGNLQEGQFALTNATVVSARLLFFGGGRRRGRTLEVLLESAGSKLRLLFFHARAAMKDKFAPGSSWTIWGRAHFRSEKSCWEMIFPECTPVTSAAQATPGRQIVVRYRDIPGVAPATWRKLSAAVAGLMAGCDEDSLPAIVREQLGVASLAQAARQLHFPEPDLTEFELQELRERKSSAHIRMAVEEAFVLYLGLAVAERSYRNVSLPQVWTLPGDEVSRSLQGLPFSLSDSQRDAIAIVARDLQAAQPMRRLLYGDVGSGKTVVGAMAARLAIAAGAQVAWMAPTEMLVEQTMMRLREWSGVAPERMAFLSASITAPERKRLLAQIARGSIDLVVGTHALFSQTVQFDRLGLVLVDEQQRFGVSQRRKLLELADCNRDARFRQTPHLLFMTATPIPRTLAQLLYGEMGVSRIEDLRPRQVTTSCLVGKAGREQALQAAVEASQTGRAFWICPRIEESDEASSTSEVTKWLTKRLGKESVEVLHGQMAVDQQRQALSRFRNGASKVLVATTIVEVGIDIPDASLMIVDDAHRFGLAQLHQLRGRVGRSGQAARQILLCAETSRTARLTDYVDCGDGFQVAEMDLRLRGPGVFFGTEQSGLSSAFMLWGSASAEWDRVKAAAFAYAQSITDVERFLREPQFQSQLPYLTSQV